MSQSDFVKAACQQCGGHFDFPADYAGQTVPCPLCGQPTELAPLVLAHKLRSYGRVWVVVGLAAVLVATVVAGALLYRQADQNGHGAATLPPVTKTNTPLPTPEPPSQIVTNDFVILPFTLEKVTNSTLVYIKGAVQNLGDRQRFGIKIQFALFDTNDEIVGAATDYQSILEAHGEWRFRALVIQSKAVSAKFHSIAEVK